MSGSLNKVMLIGNLGDDIKMHHFEDGGSIGRFPLATNETYTNKNTGEKIRPSAQSNIGNAPTMDSYDAARGGFDCDRSDTAPATTAVFLTITSSPPTT